MAKNELSVRFNLRNTDSRSVARLITALSTVTTVQAQQSAGKPSLVSTDVNKSWENNF